MLRSTLATAILLLAAPAFAAVTVYTDAAAFDVGIGAGAYLTVGESFEDDAVWGHVRTTVVDGPHTAPSVDAGYVTWTASCASCGVTTGHGPAYVGDWGFYERPHGDPNNGVNDGWIMSSSSGEPLFAVGGWFETNTFGARMRWIIDGVTIVDFEGQPLDYAHQFYGVIVDEGFTTLEIVETETMPGDEWYFIFADLFTIAIDRETGAPGAAPSPGARLLPNAPNPFNPRTAIAFELDRSGTVDLWVLDVAGRRVRTLVDAEPRRSGRHAVTWDGRDDHGRALPAAAYRCELVVGAERSSRWITLVK